MKEFSGTRAGAALCCAGLTPDALLALGVTTDGERFHVVYDECDSSMSKIRLANEVRAKLQDGFGYISHWGACRFPIGVVSMVGVAQTIRGPAREAITALMTTFARRHCRLRAEVPARIDLIVPSGQDTVTVFNSSRYIPPVNTHCVYQIAGGHIVYAWNKPIRKGDGTILHHNGMVRVASPSVGYDNPYPIHTFEGMRIMNMGIISPNNGSHEEMLSISVEFADLSVTAFLATTRDGKIVIMNRVTQPSRHAPRLSSPAYAG